MDEKELTDYVLDSVFMARTTVDRDYAPDDQGFLNELHNYYGHLRMHPNELEERRPFLESFKKYFASPYQKVIEDLDNDLGNLEFVNKKDGLLWSMEINVGVLAAFVTGAAAFMINPAFGVFAVGGIALAANGFYSASKHFPKSEKRMWGIDRAKKSIKSEKGSVERIEPEDLERVLIDNQGEIKPLLHS